MYFQVNRPQDHTTSGVHRCYVLFTGKALGKPLVCVTSSWLGFTNTTYIYLQSKCETIGKFYQLINTANAFKYS